MKSEFQTSDFKLHTSNILSMKYESMKCEVWNVMYEVWKSPPVFRKMESKAKYMQCIIVQINLVLYIYLNI